MFVSLTCVLNGLLSSLKRTHPLRFWRCCQHLLRDVLASHDRDLIMLASAIDDTGVAYRCANQIALTAKVYLVAVLDCSRHENRDGLTSPLDATKVTDWEVRALKVS